MTRVSVQHAAIFSSIVRKLSAFFSNSSNLNMLSPVRFLFGEAKMKINLPSRL
jgi:hypothetical protein